MMESPHPELVSGSNRNEMLKQVALHRKRAA